jgi:hypothetical protein
VTGQVEHAVRCSTAPGQVLATPSGRGRFTVDYTAGGLILVQGATRSRTLVPWEAVEEIRDLLRGRGWVVIGSVYSTASKQGSLDEHLKRSVKTTTAGWVAVVLERAGVVMVDRARPGRIKLQPGW